jgi:hypothetical protein
MSTTDGVKLVREWERGLGGMGQELAGGPSEGRSVDIALEPEPASTLVSGLPPGDAVGI